jgi:hypothetical protein
MEVVKDRIHIYLLIPYDDYIGGTVILPISRSQENHMFSPHIAKSVTYQAAST